MQSREDLLSVLLDKGRKLRDAMAISTLQNSQDIEQLREIKAQEIQIPTDIMSGVSNDFRLVPFISTV